MERRRKKNNGDRSLELDATQGGDGLNLSFRLSTAGISREARTSRRTPSRLESGFKPRYHALNQCVFLNPVRAYEHPISPMQAAGLLLGSGWVRDQVKVPGFFF